MLRRYLVVHTLLPDRTGGLLRLLSLIAEQHVNVLDVEHRGAGPRLPIQQVEADVALETRDRQHSDALLDLLGGQGYDIEEAQPVFEQVSGGRLAY